jgi:hypothetical protein
LKKTPERLIDVTRLKSDTSFYNIRYGIHFSCAFYVTPVEREIQVVKMKSTNETEAVDSGNQKEKMIEALLSLTIIVLLAARAVKILGS